MAKYTALVRRTKLQVLEKDTPVSIDRISAQYNPDRFQAYVSTTRPMDVDRASEDLNVLDIWQSPHIMFLAEYAAKGKGIWDTISDQPYYKMHREYGKDKKWTVRKCKTFLQLHDDIKSVRKLTEPVALLTTPIAKNPYTKDFEIYEGHHRTAICLWLNMDPLRANIYEVIT
jgi:hypothetical protein